MLLTTVPQDIKELYEGKMNFILDRFRTAFAVRDGQSTWIIQVLDFGGNVGREHCFTSLNDVNMVAAFLKKNNLVNV